MLNTLDVNICFKKLYGGSYEEIIRETYCARKSHCQQLL